MIFLRVAAQKKRELHTRHRWYYTTLAAASPRLFDCRAGMPFRLGTLITLSII
jgi:hypothetical protein